VIVCDIFYGIDDKSSSLEFGVPKSPKKLLIEDRHEMNTPRVCVVSGVAAAVYC
jgi:hypothetical protein